MHGTERLLRLQFGAATEQNTDEFSLVALNFMQYSVRD